MGGTPLGHKNSLPIFLIAVDGHGGSGKSTLASLLSEKLKAEIIHTDDFAAWDNPLNWWPLVIERVLEPIACSAASSASKVRAANLTRKLDKCGPSAAMMKKPT